jgi:hypothetical protein
VRGRFSPADKLGLAGPGAADPFQELAYGQRLAWDWRTHRGRPALHAEDHPEPAAASNEAPDAATARLAPEDGQ